MNSFSNAVPGGSAGLTQYPDFACILEAIKKHPHIRIMLDGEAGLSCLGAEDLHAHRTRSMLWKQLRRNHPSEYECQAKEQGRKNSAKLLALLRAHDPLFETTWDMLEHMFDILPDTAEYLIKKGTHANPSRFMELYEEMREWAHEVEHRKHRREHAHARARADGGRSVAEAREAKHKAELAALVARVKSGRSEEGDLLRYLELTMRGGE